MKKRWRDMTPKEQRAYKTGWARQHRLACVQQHSRWQQIVKMYLRKP